MPASMNHDHFYRFDLRSTANARLHALNYPGASRHDPDPDRPGIGTSRSRLANGRDETADHDL